MKRILLAFLLTTTVACDPGSTEEPPIEGENCVVKYDRTDPTLLAPFPDDFWTVPDPDTATGLRIEIDKVEKPEDVKAILDGLISGTAELDGFSPLAHTVLELSALVDTSSIPMTAIESLEEGASVGLFDLAPDSETYGQRVPFVIRSGPQLIASSGSALLLFPSIPLRSRGRYGLVVTQGMKDVKGRACGRSEFFAGALREPQSGQDPAVGRVRALANEVLDQIATSSEESIAREDVSLALRISVRSLETIPNDRLAIREQLDALPAPEFTVDSVRGASGRITVRGTWEAPNWRDGLFLARDAEGRPQITGTEMLPFILVLPREANEGPVPVIMHQHGNPGTAEDEVPGDIMLGEGFASIGFTDRINREVGPNTEDQVGSIFFPAFGGRLPDYWTQTFADQLAFLRFIDQLESLDVAPFDNPDGEPDLDVSFIGYHGVSEGANHGQALLAYAPEIRAGVLTVGGTRLAETLIHQEAPALLNGLRDFLPNVEARDLWFGMSLFQMLFDPQDAQNHARLIYRDPIMVAGTTDKPSVLVVEGINDESVPNNGTRSLAWTMGPLPHVRPVEEAVPFLTSVDAPVEANIDSRTTAGYIQFSCGSLDGHYCAASDPDSVAQRSLFLRSAYTETAPLISR